MKQLAAPRTQKRHLGLALCLLLVSLLLACGESSKRGRQDIAGEKPVAEIMLYRGTAYVKLEPGETLSSAVDLSLFAGFAPDTTLEEAERMHGPPERVRTRHANTYYDYRVAGARVELARLFIQSEGREVIKWELKAFPDAQQALGHFVHPSVAEQLEPDLSGVVVRESGDGESADFEIEHGSVVSIYWRRPGADVR